MGIWREARPGPARLSLWCLALDVPVREALCLLDVLQLPEWVVLAAHLNGRIDSAEMRRRDFLRLAAVSGAMATIDPGRLADVLAGIARPDRELVRDLTIYGYGLAGQWDCVPSALLRLPLMRHMETVKTLLAGPLAPGLRLDLMDVGAHAAALTGHLSRRLGRDDEARVYLTLAGQLAASAGDTGLQALALVWTADTLSGVQRASEPAVEQRHVLALLERAEGLALVSAPSSVRELTHLRLAEEHAAAGHPDEARRHVESADTAFHLNLNSEPGLYGRGWDGPVAHGAFRGNVELLCGRPQQAIAVLDGLLGVLPNNVMSSRSSILADLAAAYARHGELDKSVSLLSMAWEIADSAGLDDRRSRVLGVRRRDLGRWAAEPSVRRLDEALAVQR